MTKKSYYRGETFKEFLIDFLRKMLSMSIVGMLIFTLFIIREGDKEIKRIEENLGITYNIDNSLERKPVKEMVRDYIDSLPLPKEETIEQNVLSEVLTNGNTDGITPSIATFNISAYCPCESCCGKTDGITSSGEKATEWCTIAAGSSYEIGTIIYIPELADMPNEGWFIVQDRGGAITDDRLDIFMSTHEEALQFGRQYLECYIYQK